VSREFLSQLMWTQSVTVWSAEQVIRVARLTTVGDLALEFAKSPTPFDLDALRFASDRLRFLGIDSMESL
jgi:hypothetical protein